MNIDKNVLMSLAKKQCGSQIVDIINISPHAYYIQFIAVCRQSELPQFGLQLMTDITVEEYKNEEYKIKCEKRKNKLKRILQ